MLDELPARVIDKWRAYDAIVGLPDKRDDLRAGILASIAWNVAPKKRGAKRLQPHDFFASLKPPEKSADDTGSSNPAERMMAKARAAFGPMLQKKAAPDGQRSDAPRKP